MSSSSNLGDDSILVRTKDQQRFAISAAVTYSIDPEKVVELHLVWQNRYEENAVRPLVRGTIRDLASKYTVSEIMGSARKDMEQSISEQLASKFAENDLILINFEIMDIH